MRLSKYKSIKTWRQFAKMLWVIKLQSDMSPVITVSHICAQQCKGVRLVLKYPCHPIKYGSIIAPIIAFNNCPKLLLNLSTLTNSDGIFENQQHIF